MISEHRCQSCGAKLTGQEVDGHCANCLLKLAMAATVPPPIATPENSLAPASLGRVRYFGDYELLEEIARGGMGVVYRARQVSLNRIVALKMILAGHFSSTTMVHRFQAEAEAAARLEHPNIVPVYEIGRHEGQHYFSMRFLDGGTLTQAVARATFSPRSAAELIITVAHAVHHAHQHGILHRDLKPGNILLDGAGHPHVVDFGLAKLLEMEDGLTVSHAILGTPSYMAPEQAAGHSGESTTTTDVYSLGAILYELLTGRPPFHSKTPLETMRRVLEDPPERPGLLKPEIDRDIETICLKSLEKEPNRRYSSAAAFAEDLERWLKGEPIRARAVTPLEHIVKWARRRPTVAGLSVAIVAIALVGMVAVFWQWRKAEVATQVAEGRAAAERAAKTQEASARDEAQKAYSQVREVLSELELQKAEQLFREDKGDLALAYLARLLRDHPTHSTAAKRLITGLSEGNFVLPLSESLSFTTSYPTPKFSPDGQWIIGPYSDGFEKQMRIYSAVDGKILSAIRTNADNFFHPNFSPDGKRVLGLSGNEARFFDVRTGYPVGNAFRQGGTFYLGEFSPDSRIVAAASVRESSISVYLWDVESGRELHPPVLLDHQLSGVRSITFTADGKSLVIGTHHGMLFWNVTTGKTTNYETIVPEYGYRVVASSPNGERLLAIRARTHAELWHVSTKHLIAQLPLTRSSGSTYSEFSSDGQRLLLQDGNGTVRICDAITGQSLGQIIKHPSRITSARFSGNGQWIFAVSADNRIRVWNGHSGLPVSEWVTIEGGGRSSVLLSPDNRRILTLVEGASGHSGRLWEIRFGIPNKERDGFNGAFATALADHSHTSLSVPNWLPDFAEAVIGQRLTTNRTLETVSFATRATVREKILQNPGSDVYSELGRWFYGDVTSRPVSPFSRVTLNYYLSSLATENKLDSLYNALALAPTNALILSGIARLLLNEERLTSTNQQAAANYYSRRAVDFEPNNSEAITTRAEVLASQGHVDEAIDLLDQAIKRLPRSPDLWYQKALLLEKVHRQLQAEGSYSNAINLAETTPAWPAGKRARYRFEYSDLLRQSGRMEEANRLFAEGLKIAPPMLGRDWPMWGGPGLGRNMYSSGPPLPEGFDLGNAGDSSEIDFTTTENIKWIAQLGSLTLGNVTVANGKVFIGTNNDNPRNSIDEGDRGILMCLDERNGEFLWQLAIPKLPAGKVNDWENLGLLSSPAVEGNRVYVVSNRGEVLCLSDQGLGMRNVGPFKEEAKYSGVTPTRNGFAESISPAPRGRRDADIIWRYDMIDEVGVFPHNGSFSSPLIVGDLVYVKTSNGQDWTHGNVPFPNAPTLIALNKFTGELAGEDDANIGHRTFHANWGSASAGVVNGRTLVFFGGGDGVCYAVDSEPVDRPADSFFQGAKILKRVWWADCNPPEYRARNGKPIRYPAAEGPSEIISTPVFWRDRVYVAIGQDPEHGEGVGNLVCIDATQTGDITKTGFIWSFRGIQRSLSSVSISPDGLLFVADYSGFVYCLDAETGALHWNYDMKAHIWGSTMVADGKVFIGDEDGDFVILAATKELNVLSKTHVNGLKVDGPNLNAPVYSTPVVANGVLYVASTTHLIAIRKQILNINSAQR